MMTFLEALTPDMQRMLRIDALHNNQCKDDAEEVYQRAMVWAWQHWDVVDRDNPKGWFFGVLRMERTIYAREMYRWRRVPADWKLTLAPVDAEAEIERADMVQQARRVLGVHSDTTVEQMLGQLETRDPGRGQPLRRMPSPSCQNGHRRTPEDTRYNRDGTVRCLACTRMKR